MVMMSAFMRGFEQEASTTPLLGSFLMISIALVLLREVHQHWRRYGNKEKGEGRVQALLGESLSPSSLTQEMERQSQTSSHSRSPHYQHEEFTLLNTSWKHILMEIKNQDIIHWSDKISKRSKKEFTKYCYFYQEYRHDTEDCLVLKKEINALVCWGYLWTYVIQPKGAKAFGHQPQLAIEPLMDNLPTGSLVNTIIGGFPKGASSPMGGVHACIVSESPWPK